MDVYYLGIEETCDCDYYDTSDYNDKSTIIDDWNGRTSRGRKSKWYTVYYVKIFAG